MNSPFDIDPVVVAVILGMAVITYITKSGGLWVVGHFELSDRAEAGLDILPGTVVIAFLTPALVNGGVAEWTAAVATVFVAHKSGNLLASLIAGVGVVLLLRQFL